MEGRSLARLSGPASVAPCAVKPGQKLVMSRFAWIRRDGSQLVAESSLTAGRVALEDERAHRLLVAVAPGRELDPGVAHGAGLPLEVAVEIASLLVGAGVLREAEDATAEERPPLATWEFHDLLFHARSRPGRADAAFGGSYRFWEVMPPPPAIPRSTPGAALALERPDFDRLEREDPSLTRVQASRRSVRRYGEEPVSLSELGEFLYRVGRVEDYWETRIGGTPWVSAHAPRPYPSGGAEYSLELYPAIQACAGAKPGLYHYAADRHELTLVTPMTDPVRSLLERAAAGIGAPAETMQVVVIIAARFARVAWKYESIAYSLVLKEVGVLLQTMYLAATAMGLAPCAVGTGDSEVFAEASGIPYHEQSSVGELALGSQA
jgi:SagB-type dehydrogenase family enzyme